MQLQCGDVGLVCVGKICNEHPLRTLVPLRLISLPSIQGYVTTTLMLDRASSTYCNPVCISAGSIIAIYERLIPFPFSSREEKRVADWRKHNMSEKRATTTMPNARPSYTSPSGSTYYGPLRNGVPHGKEGIVKWHDGTVKYKGQVENGKAHGRGVYTGLDDGYTYQGQFKNGLQHGYGMETFENACSYQGEFKQGLKHGRGIFTYAHGDTYKGNFLEDEFDGLGTYTWSQSQGGGMYKGFFKEGRFHGQGIMRRQDGSIYHEGQWNNGKPIIGNNNEH